MAFEVALLCATEFVVRYCISSCVRSEEAGNKGFRRALTVVLMGRSEGKRPLGRPRRR